MRSRTLGTALAALLFALVAAYAYAAVAYLGTDAAYFPEQAPPGWAWPAVAVVGLGFVPAVLLLVPAVAVRASAGLRAAPRHRTVLTAAMVATVAMLLVMATPPGWELFDWYVS